MTIRTFAIALLIIAGLSAKAQTNVPAADSKAASSNSPGRDYPRLDSGRRVQFRIAAPDAKKVAVGLSGGQLFCNQIGV
jgi:hypothetical protein